MVSLLSLCIIYTYYAEIGEHMELVSLLKSTCGTRQCMCRKNATINAGISGIVDCDMDMDRRVFLLILKCSIVLFNYPIPNTILELNILQHDLLTT